HLNELSCRELVSRQPQFDQIGQLGSKVDGGKVVEAEIENPHVEKTSGEREIAQLRSGQAQRVKVWQGGRQFQQRQRSVRCVEALEMVHGATEGQPGQRVIADIERSQVRR